MNGDVLPKHIAKKIAARKLEEGKDKDEEEEEDCKKKKKKEPKTDVCFFHIIFCCIVTVSISGFIIAFIVLYYLL